MPSGGRSSPICALATNLAHDQVHHVGETEIIGQNDLCIVSGAKWRNGSRAILLITCQKAPQRLVMLNGFRRISTLQRSTQRPRLSRCVKEELMARLRIDNRPNISPSQDHTAAHRNLALNGAQCGTHICEGSDGGDRPLNRLALELARSKVSVIDND